MMLNRYIAVDEYTQALHDSRISHCNLLAIQSSITCIGLLVSSLLAANQVFRGHKPFGNLMILLAYWIGMSGEFLTDNCRPQAFEA